MGREENKFFKYLRWRYWVRLGWKVSIEKASQGAVVSIIVRRFDLASIAFLLIDKLHNRLEDVGVVSRVEEYSYGYHSWKWTVVDPVGALRVLASFIRIPLSDAKARLLWLGK